MPSRRPVWLYPRRPNHERATRAEHLHLRTRAAMHTLLAPKARDRPDAAVMRPPRPWQPHQARRVRRPAHQPQRRPSGAVLCNRRPHRAHPPRHRPPRQTLPGVVSVWGDPTVSYPQDCGGCAIGYHDSHDAHHGIRSRPELIGGAVCECKGDCADRWRMSMARIQELLRAAGETREDQQ